MQRIRGTKIGRVAFTGWQGITALAIAATWAVGGCESGPEQSAVKRPPEAVTTRSSSAWALNQQYDYQVRMSSRADMQSGETLDFTLDARAELTPVRVMANAVEFHLLLRDLRLGGGLLKFKEKSELLAKELAASHFFTLQQDRMKAIRIAKGLSAFAVNIVRTLAAGFQFRGDPGKGETWTAQEYDATGKYVAEYRATSEPGRWQKRKLRYQSILASSQAHRPVQYKVAVPEVILSQGEVRVEKGILKRAWLKESIQLDLMPTGGMKAAVVQPASSEVKSSTRIELSLIGESRPEVAVDWNRLRSSTEPYAAHRAYGDPGAQQAVDKAKIGDLSFEKVVAELEVMERDPEKKQLWDSKNQQRASPEELEERKTWFGKWMRLFSALTAMFRQQPDTIELAVDKIRAGSAAQQVLMSGLSSAGTEQAQRALSGLVNDEKLSERLRKAATASLIRAKRPKRQSVQTLESLLDDERFRTSATFGLGTYARHLREAGETVESDRISKILVQRLASATTDIDRVTVLRGISNSGYAGALEAVRPYFSDRESLLRQTAVDAIRLMKHPEVDSLVAHYLDATNERSYTVRVAAVNAAKVRKPSDRLARALAKAALKDPKAKVRYEAIQVMKKWAVDRPELRKTLEQVAKADSEKQNRMAARAALKSPG